MKKFHIILIVFFILFFLPFVLHSQVSLEWVARYNTGLYTATYVNAMALDSSGNVIISGNDIASPPGFVTVKFNSSGQFMWATRFSGGQTVEAQPIAIGVDTQGNIYVGAYDINYILLKYNSAGIQQWVKRYKGNGGGLDELNDIQVDENGSITVLATGYLKNNSTNWDVGTVKYNLNGDSLWARNYNPTGNNDEGGTAIDINNLGRIVITGFSGYRDFLTLSYNSEGNLLWARTWNGPGNRWDGAYDIALDKNGNIYVTGYTVKDSTGEDDIATLKYDSLGNLKWVRFYDTTVVNRSQSGHFIKIDIFGDVIVAGYNTMNDYDYCTLKYDSSGNLKWVNNYNGLANREDFLNDLAVDKLGDVYVTGNTQDVLNRYKMTTIKYDKNGTQQWLKKYPDYDTLSSGAKIIVDKNFNIFIGGTINTPGGYLDAIVLKYSQPTNIAPVSNELPKGYKLYQNYPNPFNSSSKIKFDIPKYTKVKIKVYDILGKEIATLINAELKPGTFEINFDGKDLSSGIYLYKLETENYSEIKKMIILK